MCGGVSGGARLEAAGVGVGARTGVGLELSLLTNKNRSFFCLSGTGFHQVSPLAATPNDNFLFYFVFLFSGYCKLCIGSVPRQLTDCKWVYVDSFLRIVNYHSDNTVNGFNTL